MTCFKSRKGATAIEYGLIAGLIMIFALFAVTLTGVNLKNIFNDLTSTIETASGTPPFAGFNTFGASYWDGANKNYLFESGTSYGVANQGYDNPLSEAALKSDLVNNLGSMFFTGFGTNGGPLSIPALDGPGTAINLPAMQDTYLVLEPQGSTTGYSFYATNAYSYSPISSFPGVQSSLTTACNNEGGTLTYLPSSGSGAYECTGGRYYPSTTGQTLLSGSGG